MIISDDEWNIFAEGSLVGPHDMSTKYSEMLHKFNKSQQKKKNRTLKFDLIFFFKILQRHLLEKSYFPIIIRQFSYDHWIDFYYKKYLQTETLTTCYSLSIAIFCSLTFLFYLLKNTIKNTNIVYSTLNFLKQLITL